MAPRSKNYSSQVKSTKDDMYKECDKSSKKDKKHSHEVSKNMQFFENIKKISKSNKVKEKREKEKELEKVKAELLAIEQDCIQQNMSEDELKAVFAPLYRLVYVLKLININHFSYD